MCFHPNLCLLHKSHSLMHKSDELTTAIPAWYSSEQDKCDYVRTEEKIIVEESDLVVLQLNIRGLTNKITELKSLLENITTCKKPNIILLSETWLNKSSPKFILSNYDSYNVHRTHKKGGGVSVLISNAIKSRGKSISLELNTIELCLFEIKKEGKTKIW